jgi:prophage DNA circulation protein
MLKADAQEAVPIVTAVLDNILTVSPTQGRRGSDLRTAIGDFKANAFALVQTDAYAQPLANIYNLARLTGINFAQLDGTRAIADATTPQTVGAILVRDSLIMLSLATEARIIVDTTFASRNQVMQTQQVINAAFEPIEEDLADEMDATAFMAMTGLHANLTAFLTDTARPLPRMLNFQFNAVYSTLVQAYRLYADASRADQLLAENGIVHPAFAPRIGKGLSS